MAARRSMGKYTPAKPSQAWYATVVTALLLFSVAGGYYAGIQPIGEFRFFSWHPLLMTCGMVGMAGTAAMTKKLGGYTSTKLHAIFSWSSIMLSGAGMYVIYRNKELGSRPHLQSRHAICGACVMLSFIGLGLVGSIALHPDFGLAKTNKSIRTMHKIGARITILVAWFTAFYGLYQMVGSRERLTLALYGVPLLLLMPIVLL